MEKLKEINSIQLEKMLGESKGTETKNHTVSLEENVSKQIIENQHNGSQDIFENDTIMQPYTRLETNQVEDSKNADRRAHNTFVKSQFLPKEMKKVENFMERRKEDKGVKELSRNRLNRELHINEETKKTAEEGRSRQDNVMTRFSESSRWRNVITGNVRDKASKYLENDIFKSPSTQNKIFIKSTSDDKSGGRKVRSKSVNDKDDDIVPWRRHNYHHERQEEIISPTVNFLSVCVSPTLSSRENDSSVTKQIIKKDGQEVIKGSKEGQITPVIKKSKQEAVEDLDKTMKQLELHSDTLCTGKENKSSTTAMVAQAAVSMKDAAGAVRAVREVAQSLLRSISSDIHSETKNTEDMKTNTKKSEIHVSERNVSTSPPDLQESIKGKVKRTSEILQEIDELNKKLNSKAKSQEAIKMVQTKEYSRDVSDSDDDSFCYEEDVSVGIDLPLALYSCSGRINTELGKQIWRLEIQCRIRVLIILKYNNAEPV